MPRIENIRRASEHYRLSFGGQNRCLTVQIVHQVDAGRHTVTRDILEIIECLNNQRINFMIQHRVLKFLHIDFCKLSPINLFPTRDVT